jgi:hypothetical protein
MGASLVDLAIAKRELIAQSKSKFAQPPVIGTRLANPDGTGVVAMSLFVCSRLESGCVYDPMGRVEKLCGFKNHLYDMLVAMMNRCHTCVEV